MLKQVEFRWNLPPNRTASLADEIRGEIIIPIPPITVTAEDAGLPGITAEVLELCRDLPEVVRYYREVDLARSIDARVREVRKEIAGLADRRNEASGVDELIAITNDVNSLQKVLDSLLENAERIAQSIPKLREGARRAHMTRCDSEMHRHRKRGMMDAAMAKRHADSTRTQVTEAIDALLSSPLGLAMVEADSEARRTEAVSSIINLSAAQVIRTVDVALGLSGS